MKETTIEGHLKSSLEAHGFKVLKLETPGTSGTPDRLILRPTWSPGPPWFVELKRPKADGGREPRRLQILTMQDWEKRGLKVLPYIDSAEQAKAIAAELYNICVAERPEARLEAYRDTVRGKNPLHDLT